MKMQLSCGCCEVAEVGWERMLSIVGPLNDDTTLPGYNRTWYQRIFTEIGVTIPRWHGDCTAADRTQWNTVYGGVSPTPILFKPFRWRIGSDRTLDTTYGTTGVGGGYFEERLFFSLPSSRWVSGDDKTPPASARLDLSNVLVIQPPFWESALTNSGSKVTHCRVWIDGVDATGPVEIDKTVTVAITNVSPHLNINSGRFVSVHSIEIPGGIPEGATIEIDYWYSLLLSRSDAESTTFITAPDKPLALSAMEGSVSETPSGFAVGHNRTHTLAGSGIVRNGSNRRRYRLELIGGTLADQSEFLTSDENWTKSSTNVVYVDPVTSHSINFHFAEEVPVIFLSKPGVSFATTIAAKYMIQGTDYPAIKAYADGSAPDVSVGNFNPSTETTFDRVGVKEASVFNFGYSTGGSSGEFPTSIIVSRP